VPWTRNSVDSPCAPACCGDVPGGALEGADELAADDLPLGLRVGHPGQRAEELGGGVHHVQPDPGGGHEVLLDLLRLALAQQPVIDEDAGQPVPDGPLDERRGDRGVDPAGQPADRAAAADLLPDPVGLLLDDVQHRPGRPAAGRLEEPAEDLVPYSVCITSGWNCTP
jgi:hypothetical protein